MKSRRFRLVALGFLLASHHFTAENGVTGQWAADVFPAVTLNLQADGSRLSGSFTSTRGQTNVASIYDARVDGNAVIFKADSPDGGRRTISFAGTLDGDRIVFTREVVVAADGTPGGPGIFGLAGPRAFVMRRVTSASRPAEVDIEQQADPDFDPSVSSPAYATRHPQVLLDEAHFNFHTAAGRYKPFADLLANDGYRVSVNAQRFTADNLRGHDVLVIANPRAAAGADENRAAQPAFTDDECSAVYEWVRQGGALLLVADHFPSGAAARGLASRFGIQMRGGWTTDESHHESMRNTGTLVFSEENGLLGEHAILAGRSGSERVKRVTTFVGQSLSGPNESRPLLKLADTAMDLLPDRQFVSAAGQVQALALTVGAGRIVAFGEAAALTAQISVRGKSGMSFPGSDNRQLVLNTMHWLSRLLN